MIKVKRDGSSEEVWVTPEFHNATLPKPIQLWQSQVERSLLNGLEIN